MSNFFSLPYPVRIANDSPTDERFPVADDTVRDQLIIDLRAYEGMIIWHIADDTHYFLKILDTGNPGSSVWETFGDGSGSFFDSRRPINKTPQVGEIPGKDTLVDFNEEIFYGINISTIFINSIDPLQIGELIAPTVKGTFTRNDFDTIDSITVFTHLDVDVGNPPFSALDQIVNISFQVDTPIIALESPAEGYYIEVKATINGDQSTFISLTETVTTIFPILYGAGAIDLNATDKYSVLSKLIESDGNKTLPIDSANNRVYFGIPEEYPSRLFILDSSRLNVLTSLLPDPPIVEVVTSTGLASNWTHNYKIYQALYDTDSPAENFTFVLDETLGVNNNLDEIAEGDVNKHLTKSLKEKLINFQNPLGIGDISPLGAITGFLGDFYKRVDDINNITVLYLYQGGTAGNLNWGRTFDPALEPETVSDIDGSITMADGLFHGILVTSPEAVYNFCEVLIDENNLAGGETCDLRMGLLDNSFNYLAEGQLQLTDATPIGITSFVFDDGAVTTNNPLGLPYFELFGVTPLYLIVGVNNYSAAGNIKLFNGKIKNIGNDIIMFEKSGVTGNIRSEDWTTGRSTATLYPVTLISRENV